MVAHENNDAPALPLCILLKRHQQVHDVSGLGPAIEEIARLNEDCGSSRPAFDWIDQPGSLKNPDESIKIAMDVGDGYDTLCLRRRCQA
jgi:hypothetical protein